MPEEIIRRKRRLSSFQIIILGFAGVILLGALLPLLPFGTGKLRERGCRPMPLKPSSHRAAEHHPQAAAENCSGNYDFPFFHP